MRSGKKSLISALRAMSKRGTRVHTGKPVERMRRTAAEVMRIQARRWEMREASLKNCAHLVSLSAKSLPAAAGKRRKASMRTRRAATKRDHMRKLWRLSLPEKLRRFLPVAMTVATKTWRRWKWPRA